VDEQVAARKTAAGRRVVSVPAELVVVIEQHLADNVGPRRDAPVFTDNEGTALGRASIPGRRRPSGCTQRPVRSAPAAPTASGREVPRLQITEYPA
jgi:hypothetical protein